MTKQPFRIRNLALLAVTLMVVLAAAPTMAAETDAAMNEMCQKMMAEHHEMQAQATEWSERLENLLAVMDSTSGQDEAAAMALVIHELAAQQTAMQQQMLHQPARMMQHTMAHMPDDTQHDMEGMTCPMMKEMKGDESSADSDHSEHHRPN